MHTVSFHARRPRVEMRLQEHESRLTYGERGAIDELRERMFMVFVRRAKRKGRGYQAFRATRTHKSEEAEDWRRRRADE